MSNSDNNHSYAQIANNVDVDETSPLASPPVKFHDEFHRQVREEEEEEEQQIMDDDPIAGSLLNGFHDQEESKTTLYLFLLTLSIGG
jgi:hypothetical protein